MAAGPCSSARVRRWRRQGAGAAPPSLSAPGPLLERAGRGEADAATARQGPGGGGRGLAWPGRAWRRRSGRSRSGGRARVASPRWARAGAGLWRAGGGHARPFCSPSRPRRRAAEAMARRHPAGCSARRPDPGSRAASAADLRRPRFSPLSGGLELGPRRPLLCPSGAPPSTCAGRGGGAPAHTRAGHSGGRRPRDARRVARLELPLACAPAAEAGLRRPWQGGAVGCGASGGSVGPTPA